MSQTKQLRLSVLPTSPPHARAGWLLSGQYKHATMDMDFYQLLAKQAEEGKIDMLFVPDKYMTGDFNDEGFHSAINGWPEPITLMSALIGVTQHIGLSVTASTTYWEPYHVARMLASMDHLSKGRASWNIVSSHGDMEGHNFEHMRKIPLAKRQQHSEEFEQVVRALWSSWQADAICADTVSKQFTRAGSIQPINHEGEWFSVQGALNVPRPPQGHPVLVQAGSSAAFRERAARSADLVFTALPNLTQAQAFYRDLKDRTAKHGRTPADVLLLPGLNLTIGDTEAEVRDKQAMWQELAPMGNSMEYVSATLGHDVRDYKLSDTLPVPDDNAGSKYRKLYSEAQSQNLHTIGELNHYLSQRVGHLRLAGTPIQIADTLQQWLEEEGADGFTYIPSLLPNDLIDLTQKIIPELQNRGIFKADYSGSNLRERLGLSGLS